MKLSKLSSALLAGGLLMTAVSAQADEASGPFTTSGSVAMTTDYFYRGVTQTDSPALQGNIMLSHESGAYFNVWGSNVNFAGNLELDPSIGFTGKAGDVTYDVGVLYYGYPNSTAIDGGVNADFVELYGSVAFAGAKFGVAYSPDFTYETDSNIYLNASYGLEVGAGFTVSAYVGYSMGDATETLFVDDYLDYKVAVSKSVLDLTAELAVIGSTLDEDDVGDLAESGAVVFTVSKAF